MKNPALLLAVLLFAALARAAEVRPNVVLILADDLGWADLACYGNTFNETPHLDRLAREGLRFTQFYAGPVCSPTRANLQSGRDQARFGITQHIPGHRRPYARLIDPVVPLQLPLEVETFAERLRSAGYTTGYFGKWHLGGDDHGPMQQGWDTAVEFTGNTVPARITGGDATRRSAEYLAGKAEEFIAANRDRPFVLQVSPSAVHIPLSTTPELLAKYRARKPMAGYPSRPEYAGLLEELDQCVGRIVAAVDRAGLAEKTLVLFLSDNGGLIHQQDGKIVTSNAPLRGEKGSLYEGGIRVPALARWKGRIQAGGTTATLATTMDIHPTLLALARVAPASAPAPDGVSLAPLLGEGSGTLARDTLTWHLPHYHHSTPASAIRRGDWKLIEFFETDTVELYHLGQDPGETTNLTAREPERAGELRTALADWRRAVGARMPQPNPDHDPARANELGRSSAAKKKQSAPR